MGERREVFARRKDGTEFPAEAAISKLKQAGKTTFTAVIRDITERKRIEEAVNPIAGVKNLFTRKNAVEFLKTAVKLAIVGGMLGSAVVQALPQMVRSVRTTPLGAAALGGSIGSAILLRAAAVFAALAALDVAYQRWQHRRDLRMTKDEVKREHKESEGDPQIKQQRERIHREILTHNMIEEVRRADCVIVNPDHIAVAIRFDEENNEAPEVVAKGERLIAKRILEVARAHGVPIVRDVGLARALNELDLGTEIPEALYEAVAEVLRFVYAESQKEGHGPEEAEEAKENR